jgi:DNA-binding response OmpR family regulator
VTSSRYEVLVAGADPTFRRAVADRLSGDAFELMEQDDIGAVVAHAGSLHADMVLLRLDGSSTLDTVRRFRSATSIPLLALVDAGTDWVEAIEAGADDSLRIPCSPREVAAKLRSAARRQGWARGRDGTLDFGEIAIDRVARDVRVHDRRVMMPQREFELLAFLAQEPRRVFSRTELLERVWHASADWLGLATVTEHVRRLRHRLAAAGTTTPWICTVRGAGYRFDPGQCRAECTG